MLNVTLTVELSLKGPILTQSTSAGACGVDSVAARNAEGRCYLAGTLVKGRLRQAWEELLPVPGLGFNPRIDDWLGRGAANEDSDESNKPIEPWRGRLHFEDFLDHAERHSEKLYRISLDEQRGAVRKGAYQVIEAPYAPGANSTFKFKGNINYFAVSDEEADQIKHCVEIGLRWITSLGAGRTIGFGRLAAVSVCENRQRPHAVVNSSVTDTPVLDFALRPFAPFCIARRRVNNNLFESEVVVPGGVLKGCIATSWRTRLDLDGDGQISDGMDPARPELSRHFERLRFTHAFPGSASPPIRPNVPPLSLVKFERKDKTLEIRDVVLCDGPVLLGDKPAAPTFAVDWKSHADVQSNFGWPDVRRELRVRTKIDTERRKAQDEQLFAYDMVVPGNTVWNGRIDLSQIPDAIERKEVERQLRDVLSQGLFGLGKTKCRAEVRFHPQGTVPPVYASNPSPRDGSWIVTLQTPALLCDPSRLDESSGHEELCAAYSETWRQISGDSLQLVRFFARQSLAGGFYLHRRFQPGKAYNPFLLTEAGSVFVLRPKAGQAVKAQQCIDQSLAHGLSFPDWAIERYRRNGLPGDHWKNCPYLSANGYGEIAVNLDLHWDSQPREGECHVV
jgi:hypothetical protein